jgi:hypothetical protein
MPPVAVRILHPKPGPDAGPLACRLADARSRVADRHRRGFLAVGATDVEIVSGPPDDRSYGERLRGLVDPRGGRRGLVVLGSGAIPLATAADRRAFVTTASGDDRKVLANNRFSADVVAISRVETLPAIPDLPGDNALPRWLEEVAGYRIDDLRRRWRLSFDLDGPLDLVLLGETDARGRREGEVSDTAVADRLAAVRAVATDRRAELLVAGRTSAATLGWLEVHAAARVRAWVEERGLRAASRLAQASDPDADPGLVDASGVAPTAGRAPASILGLLLDRDGPGSLGANLARFADAAIVDTRVLMAHRLGADEIGWPPAEDRFASDLLLADAVADPWLRELTTSAADASIPILLGGHTLVGPGVRLVVAGPVRGARWT